MCRGGRNVAVRIGIAGCPGNDSCRSAVEGVVVYLRRGPVTRSGARPRALHRMGRVSASGTLTFRVPHLSPGRHHLGEWVTVSGRRRWLPVTGTFRIVRG